MELIDTASTIAMFPSEEEYPVLYKALIAHNARRNLPLTDFENERSHMVTKNLRGHAHNQRVLMSEPEHILFIAGCLLDPAVNYAQEHRPFARALSTQLIQLHYELSPD